MVKWLPIFLSLCAGAIPAAAGRAKNPWFGTWKLELPDPIQAPETLVYSDAGHGAMRMVSVEQKSIIVTRFDGRPAPDIGEGRSKGHQLAVRAVSPTRYTWTFFVAGKPLVRGRNRLAPDRRSFEEVSWLVAKPSDRVTLVYRRQ